MTNLKVPDCHHKSKEFYLILLKPLNCLKEYTKDLVPLHLTPASSGTQSLVWVGPPPA